ncbi:related to oxidoreductase [Melanopsichium pennsylvanicum]|uniref:Related to oxidoreductase n=2 Tax=Melanopsichium pennsylvanicum TaxID=63383 RepID=A0AAJ4XGS9_9BASI|nr:related to oxidoreductase [Melanopsichium pennsylvanicum 4]SNX82042.1 related to oxidoreductase [Melanopsichium pennsylvanicum]
MSAHAAIKAGNLAVISGGASGIGLAAAKFYLSQGMKVAIGDRSESSLQSATKALADKGESYIGLLDVSDQTSVSLFRKSVFEKFGGSKLTVLMANAGVAGPTKAMTSEGWDRILSTNFYGVVNICQAFLPDLKTHRQDALLINTGSKQGITTPPGTGPAYNISKAAVKVFTESLAHELREDKSSKVDVKLLIPGWVHTGLTGAADGKPKPDGAWTPEQTVDFMLERIQAGSFYILCPDNETKRETDLARMEWNVNDVIQDRPALSRWHEDYSTEFNDFVKSKTS